MVLFLLTRKYFSDVKVEDVQRASREFLSFIDERHHDIIDELHETKVVSDELSDKLKVAADEFFKGFAQ
jgi:F-type H+-transporting ATPase subunit alpha